MRTFTKSAASQVPCVMRGVFLTGASMNCALALENGNAFEIKVSNSGAKRTSCSDRRVKLATAKRRAIPLRMERA
jgi:hypothetical protein